MYIMSATQETPIFDTPDEIPPPPGLPPFGVSLLEMQDVIQNIVWPQFFTLRHLVRQAWGANLLHFPYNLVGVHSREEQDKLCAYCFIAGGKYIYLESETILMSLPLTNLLADHLPLDIPFPTPINSTLGSGGSRGTSAAGSTRARPTTSSTKISLVSSNLDLTPATSAGSGPDRQSSDTPRASRSEHPCNGGNENECTQHFGLMGYRFLGNWDDFADEINDKEKGLRSEHLAAPLPHCSKVLNLAVLGRDCDVGRVSESEIGVSINSSCLDKVAAIVAVGTREVSPACEYGGEGMRHGDKVKYTDTLRVDHAIKVKGPDGKDVLLLLVEAKKPSLKHFVDYIRWHYHIHCAPDAPFEQPDCVPPSQSQMKRCLDIMNQLVSYCFKFGTSEIALCDGYHAFGIQFDFSDVGRAPKMGIDKLRKDSSRGARKHRSHGIVGFRVVSTTSDSTELPVTFLMTALAWRQVKYIVDEAAFEAEWATVKNAADDLGVDPEVSAKEIGKEEPGPQFNAKSQEGSSDRAQEVPVGKSVERFSFEAIQYSSSRMHRVVRMQREQFGEWFDLPGNPSSIVLKVLDFVNLRAYYETFKRWDLTDYTWDEFREECINRWRTEVECYQRIAVHNKKRPETPIHTPKLLQYGACCFEADDGNTLCGMYLVLEDLGHEQCDFDPNDDNMAAEVVAEDVQRMTSIGIKQNDVSSRNILLWNGHPYLFDFNLAKLSSPPAWLLF